MGMYLARQVQTVRSRASQTQQNLCPAQAFLPVNVSVLVLEYFPKDPGNPDLLDGIETGWRGDATVGGRTISFWEQKTDEMVDAAIPIINESTKYHGYKDAAAQQFLNYTVLERKKFYNPIPRGFRLGTNQQGSPNYRPDYNSILSNLNICDYVDSRGIKEVWMYGYHSDVIVPDESRMSSKYGDVSNSLPKEESLPARFKLPVCQNSYVLYNFTYQPGGKDTMSNNFHNRLHQIENIIPFIENKWPPVREDRVDTNIPGSVFWGDFSEYVQDYTERSTYRSSCGNSHNTPNWSDRGSGYLYNLTGKRDFNCETWHPDDTRTTYINAGCERWGCSEIGYYKWWMQNLPGYNNGIEFQGRKMRNWWEGMYDFNAFVEKGRSLYADSIFRCEGSTSPTPSVEISASPTASPTVTPTPSLMPPRVPVSATPEATLNPITGIFQKIFKFFNEVGDENSGDQNNDKKINELDFGAVYSR